ncbi:MAG: GNAT family N-acetyltransferase [Ginsengibacter sp.]
MKGEGQSPYRIESLTRNHERKNFSCRVAELDRYLHQQITQDQKKHITAPFVLVEDASLDVAGYYTLSSIAVDLSEWPPELAKKLPRYPTVPVVLLGRLAVDQKYRGQKLGEFLLMDALSKALANTDTVAATAVIVDAINDEAASFYQHYDFQQFPEQPSKLLLSIRTIAKMF